MSSDAVTFSPVFMSPWAQGPREIACHRCRHRKKRCDKKRPTCSECAKAGTECQLLRPKKVVGSRAPAAGYVQRLEEHVASLEKRLKAQPGIADDHLSPLIRRRSLRRSHPPTPLSEEEVPVVDLDNVIFDDCAVESWMPETIDEILPPLDVTSFGPVYPESDESTFTVPHNLPLNEDLITVSNPSFGMNTTLAERHVSVNIGERYVHEYFKNAHPMWPFLHKKQWEDCWNHWRSPASAAQKSDWMSFFVDMVLSVGAILAQNSESAPFHTETSKSLYDRALSKYNSYAIQGRSPLLKAQSALLLTIHAMHLDSVQALVERAQEAMMHCAVAQLHRNRSQKLDETQREIEETIRKHTILETDDTATDPSLDGLSPGSSNGLAHRESFLEDHVFRLRRIQYRILKVLRKLEYEAQQENHVMPNLWRSNIRHDLSRWIADVVAFSAAGPNQERFMSQLWLLKLANYTIISLFPNPHLAVRSADARYLVTAASEALITFRRLRVKENTSCYTWTALLHQFQAGIIMMYSLWATPTHQQLLFYDRRAFCEASFACYATLVEFAKKWEKAVVFQDVFEVLTQSIPITEFGDATQQWSLSPDKAVELQQLIISLERLQVKQRIILLLQEIAQGPRPCYTAPSVNETQWIQYEYMGE